MYLVTYAIKKTFEMAKSFVKSFRSAEVGLLCFLWCSKWVTEFNWLIDTFSINQVEQKLVYLEKVIEA